MRRFYDFALDCNTCGQLYTFGSLEERTQALKDEHEGHETDVFRQARV